MRKVHDREHLHLKVAASQARHRLTLLRLAPEVQNPALERRSLCETFASARNQRSRFERPGKFRHKASMSRLTAVPEGDSPRPRLNYRRFTREHLLSARRPHRYRQCSCTAGGGALRAEFHKAVHREVWPCSKVWLQAAAVHWMRLPVFVSVLKCRPPWSS